MKLLSSRRHKHNTIIFPLSGLTRVLPLLCIILFCLVKGTSKPYISYNSEIVACYQNIIHLRIKEAENQIIQLKQNQKENLAIVHMENYIDFFRLFITENKQEFQKRIAFKDQRIKQLDAVSIDDPHFAFIKAEILLQWALIQIKFDEKIAAGSNVFNAYKLLEGNKKKYPNFKENNKSLSILHVLAESVPKWVRTIIGVKGSIQLGKQEIESLVNEAVKNKSYMYRDEVAAIYTYILFYQINDKEAALSQFTRFNLDHTHHPLIAFLKASIYQRAGKNEECLNVLNDLQMQKDQLPFYYLEFMKGRAYLNKQDFRAKAHLLNFVNNFSGQHFIKEAFQKLAWFELSMNNDPVAYRKYLSACRKKGQSLVDEDKQAEKEAVSGKIPMPFLLKARLLYDGGYYKAALDVLTSNEKNLNNKPDYKLEYYYRAGRIYQAMNSNALAIQYLKNTIEKGEKSNSYYAASAALQLGIMYEDSKQWERALFYFQKCQQMGADEYKTSLHQKAKSGEQRVKSRTKI